MPSPTDTTVVDVSRGREPIDALDARLIDLMRERARPAPPGPAIAAYDPALSEVGREPACLALRASRGGDGRLVSTGTRRQGHPGPVEAFAEAALNERLTRAFDVRFLGSCRTSAPPRSAPATG
ncbi:hypothetical protein [Streptomyces sp. NPDC023327]|uniref:hypothetical protein n=1 Tax=Streptomyces sp. NPDC023327 TaxID=3157088 RepID=UPI0034108D50